MSSFELTGIEFLQAMTINEAHLLDVLSNQLNLIISQKQWSSHLSLAVPVYEILQIFFYMELLRINLGWKPLSSRHIR